MREIHPPRGRAEIPSTGSRFSLRGPKSRAASLDRHPPPPQQFRRPERKEERKTDTTGVDELGRLRREVWELKAQVDSQRTEISKLAEVEQMLRGKCERRDYRISRLEDEVTRMRASLQQAGKVQTQQQDRGMQERLKQAEQLLEARSAELSEAQAFLSTADRLSEMEVLDIVRDLNENIYQVAVGLTEEWAKLEPSKPPSKIKLDLTSKQRPIILVQLARNRDLTGLTFLLQLDLCRHVVSMTSTWVHRQDCAVLKDVYHRLSASGECHIVGAKRYVAYIHVIEGQAISARWRSLAHSYLSKQPPTAAWMADQLAKVLSETGTFASPQQSSEFVRKAALERIESVVQTAQRLEKAFMVDVTSSDMSIFFENPSTSFDGAKMINEFGAGSVWKPGRRGRIAGTTEVGVQKSACKKPGEPRHVEILLKPKVVLEKDVIGDGK